MGERLERLDVRVVSGEPGERDSGYRFHVSKSIKIWKPCQEACIEGLPGHEPL